MTTKAFAVCFLLYSCAQPNNKHVLPKVEKKAAVLPQAATITSDTVFVNSSCAVFIEPDTSLIEQRKKLLGEETFQAGFDDDAYYMNECYIFFEKQHVPIIETNGKKYIRFSNKEGLQAIIRTDTLEELWNIYLFDPSKAPYKADMIMMEEEYARYFGRDSQ